MPFRFVARLPGRFRSFGSTVVLALAVALGATAVRAQAPAGGPEAPAAAPAPAPPAGPSFAIDVRAPASVTPTLQRHMELRRYREVSDLDDAELARLTVLAERDVRELVGTLGFFDPKISVRRETVADKPLIVVEVDPGAPTLVAGVDIGFEGDIATNEDAGVVTQREEIRGGWRLPVGRRFTQEGWDDAKTSALRQLLTRRYPAGRI